MSKLEVIELVDNNLILPFDKGLKLFVLGPDFVPQCCDDLVTLIFNALFKLGKFVLNVLEIVLELLKHNLCLLSDNSID